MSRRRFLLGVGAAGVAAAAGVTVVRPRRVANRLGLLDSPDASVPPSNWPIERGDGWAIATPPTTPVGVVICLHGRNDDHRFAFEAVHLHDVAADIGVPLAIAAIDGTASAYWHPRADGRNPMAKVLDEFIPLVGQRVGAMPRTLLGWSMGGYGALLIASERPELFTAVCAASPALWYRYDDSADGAFDNAADFTAHDVFQRIDRLAGLTVRIDCGADDGFEQVARDLAERLPNANPGGFSAGFHDAAYWRSIAAAQLTTIAAAV